MRVLIACEFSGIVRDAFIRRGHDAWSCDLLPTEKPGPHIQDDVLRHLDEGWGLMIAHPPCTDLSVSGARWFKQKKADGRQQKAIEFFMTLAAAPVDRIAIENPVCIMATVWRHPDQTIHPGEYGHKESKATCLWLKNLPPLWPTKIMVTREPRCWKEPPGPNRWKNRSRTYPGIADAMADQWTDFAECEAARFRRVG